MMRLLTYLVLALTATSAAALDVPQPDRELWPQSPQARQIAQVVLFSRGGNAFYYLTDYQGNNIAVVDAAGSIIQRTDYYPYGEPWRYPDGQQYLYSDKELTRADGRHAYTFPARTLLPNFPRWSTPDPLAEQAPWDSPYAYCAANPIANIDPTGENYNVIFDKDAKSITISAIIGAGPDGFEYIQSAARFWNSLSNKYNYNGYSVQFDLKVEQIEIIQNLSEITSVKAFVNQDKFQLNNGFFIDYGDHDENINGNTQGGRLIRVYDDAYNYTQVAKHEIGHILGLEHSSGGLMTAAQTDVNRRDDIYASQVNQIIENAIVNSTSPEKLEIDKEAGRGFVIGLPEEYY